MIPTVTRVFISKFAEKQIRKLPVYIQEALFYWIKSVELSGVRKIRLIPGYHDEPLKGDRFGERSVRLNRSYRVIYQELNSGVKILIIEVNKHEY